MRLILTALALAGAIVFACAPAAAQGVSWRDVTGAMACPAPFECDHGRIAGLPHRADRAGIAAMVDAGARAEGVPSRMARALVRVESNFNPRLRGRAGEYGLTQIKCGTARGLGFAGGCAALLDPATNLKWGLRHARRALDRGSIGFHQTGLGARTVSAAYVRKINAAM
jgi:soluble lytic murein transglycosylase-like protein